ncbi:hypothetical protein [Streptomyces sclerotialus]|uniref:hypothetical protein n=1 Tax=Streptomyces sclerotialus TaxID=1957 RepID=UPI0018CB9FD2
MAMQVKESGKRSGQGLLWLFGAILAVQGFGSAVTEAAWNTSFGVAGLLRAAHVPAWGNLLVGFAGAALLVAAAYRHRARKRADS